MRPTEPLKEEGTSVWEMRFWTSPGFTFHHIPQSPNSYSLSDPLNHYPEESEQLNKMNILWQNVGLSITFSHYYSYVNLAII